MTSLDQFTKEIESFETVQKPPPCDCIICEKIVNDERWFYTPTIPEGDINRDITIPGHCSIYPNGAIKIQVANHLWLVAVLPYEYVNLTVQEMVSVLWSDLRNPSFGPDVQLYP